MDFSYVESNLDLILGIPLLLLVLDAARRSLGWIFRSWSPSRPLRALWPVRARAVRTRGLFWEVIVRNLYCVPRVSGG